MSLRLESSYLSICIFFSQTLSCTQAPLPGLRNRSITNSNVLYLDLHNEQVFGANQLSSLRVGSAIDIDPYNCVYKLPLTLHSYNVNINKLHTHHDP
jgi:hypothetical protein